MTELEQIAVMDEEELRERCLRLMHDRDLARADRIRLEAELLNARLLACEYRWDLSQYVGDYQWHKHYARDVEDHPWLKESDERIYQSGHVERQSAYFGPAASAEAHEVPEREAGK